MESFISKYYRPIFVILLLTGLVCAFFLGRSYGANTGGNQVVLSCTDDVLKSLAIPLTKLAAPQQPATDLDTKTDPKGAFVGSKNGTKYYTPGCPAATRIKPDNMIWFKDAGDATLQGYSRGSC